MAAELLGVTYTVVWGEGPEERKSFPENRRAACWFADRDLPVGTSYLITKDMVYVVKESVATGKDKRL